MAGRQEKFIEGEVPGMNFSINQRSYTFSLSPSALSLRSLLIISLAAALMLASQTRLQANSKNGKEATLKLAEQPISEYKLRRQRLMEKVQ